MFVFSTTLLCIFVFSFCWVYIVKIKNSEDITIWRAMTKTPASIVLIIYCFVCVWFVGGLSVFHFYLMSTNQVNYYFTLGLRLCTCVTIVSSVLLSIFLTKYIVRKCPQLSGLFLLVFHYLVCTYSFVYVYFFGDLFCVFLQGLYKLMLRKCKSLCFSCICQIAILMGNVFLVIFFFAL